MLHSPCHTPIKALFTGYWLLGFSALGGGLSLDVQYYQYWFSGQERQLEEVQQGYVGDRLLMQLILTNNGNDTQWAIDLDQDLPQNTRLIELKPSNHAWLSRDGLAFHPWPWQQNEQFQQVKTVRWQVNDIQPKQQLLFELEFEILP